MSGGSRRKRPEVVVEGLEDLEKFGEICARKDAARARIYSGDVRRRHFSSHRAVCLLLPPPQLPCPSASL